MILYDVIEYLKDCADADSELIDNINVLESYKYSHKTNSTEIQVQIIDHSEFDRFTTFDDGKVYISPLQIDVYATQGQIGVPEEVTVDGETVTQIIPTDISAQKYAYLLAQKVISWLNVNDIHGDIPEIISCRNGTYTSAIPIETGIALYRCVVRIDLYLEHN